VVLRLPCLAVVIVLSSYDILFARVASFLIVALVTGHENNASGAAILPLLITLGAFPSALNGAFRWWCSPVTRGCFRMAQYKGGPNRLLTRGVPSGDVEQIFGGFWLITSELMY
jgi:hypothetical protein